MLSMRLDFRRTPIVDKLGPDGNACGNPVLYHERIHPRIWMGPQGALEGPRRSKE